MVASLHFTVCFVLIPPSSATISKEWRGSGHVWCGWAPELAWASWGVIPVGGDDEGAGGRRHHEDEGPADLRKLPLPLLQQQPEDLVKVQHPEFLGVPLRELHEIINKCDIVATEACRRFAFKVNDDVFIGKGWVECLYRDELSIYHKVCALLVPTEKRIWFSCNSIAMPPAGYMLQHATAEHKYCILRRFE